MDLEQRKIKAALNKADLTLAGALDALAAIQAKGDKAKAKEYEQFARGYPLSFVLKPATVDEHNNTLVALHKKYDNDKAMSVAVRTGADITYEEPERLDTGNLALNWILGGGLPRGWIAQLKGEESRGKTFIALKTAVNTVLRGGRVLWVAAERWSKPWARTLGLTVPYAKDELDHPKVTPEIRQLMLDYNKVYAEAGARITVMTAQKGNDLLQSAVDSIALNTYDLVVVDSLAVMLSKRTLDEKQVGDYIMAGESVMIGQFCGRAEAALNHVESKRGRILSTTWVCQTCGVVFDSEQKKAHKKCGGKKPKWEGSNKVGERVRAVILVINQMRTQGIGSKSGHTYMDTPGGQQLKHTKGIDIHLTRSMDMSTTVDGAMVYYGKRVMVRTSKSKVCPPHREGLIELWVETVPGFALKGSYALVTDLVGATFGGGENPTNVSGLGVTSGVIEKSGNWFVVGDNKFNGVKKFTEFLAMPENFILVQALRAAVQQWIEEHGRNI